MAVEVQDVLSVDAVFVGLELLRNNDEIAACSTALGSEIITEVAGLLLGSPQSTSGQARLLKIPRARMLMETSAHRTRAMREYPASIDDVDSVVQLTTQAIANTDLQAAVPSSFGFNIELVYNQDSGENAFTYLGQRLFARASDLNEKWGHVGGSGKLVAHEGNWEWTISLEPRFQAADAEKVFLSANLHVPESRMPNAGEMKTMLERLWTGVHDLIAKLDGRDHE